MGKPGPPLESTKRASTSWISVARCGFLGGLMEGPKNGAEFIKDEDSTSKNKQESESNG